jgi:hypothetical protein
MGRGVQRRAQRRIFLMLLRGGMMERGGGLEGRSSGLVVRVSSLLPIGRCTGLVVVHVSRLKFGRMWKEVWPKVNRE